MAIHVVQPLGAGHRQGPQQQRVDQAERRGAGADRESQRQDRGGGGHLASS